MDGLPGGVFDYQRRLNRLAAKPVTVHVVRKGDSTQTPVPVTVPVAVRYDTGLRMRLGPVTAVRRGSPADRAGVLADPTGGDVVVSVSVPTPGGARLFTTDPAELTGAATFLDPLRLPFELNQWAAGRPMGAKVTVTVLRNTAHSPQRTALDLDWDDSYRDEPAGPSSGGNTPVPVNGLGLAYTVLAVVGRVEPGSAAAGAGVKPGDAVGRVRYHAAGPDGRPLPQPWTAIQSPQWLIVDANVQARAPHTLGVEIDRDGKPVQLELAGRPDPTWPQTDRGLALALDARTQRAGSVGEALEMGAYRTSRAVRMTYQSLYATAFGRIKITALSGPITMARASYLIAGQDVWHLLIWMALISVNLAVVNFLPVPVLDGGHMVFLGYEAVRGKPAPVAVQVILTYAGLALIGCLMLFVIGLDVYRLFF